VFTQFLFDLGAPISNRRNTLTRTPKSQIFRIRPDAEPNELPSTAVKLPTPGGMSVISGRMISE